MSNANYDFSLETIASPATPPAGLALSANSLMSGQIVEGGFRSVGSTNNKAVWEHDNTFTGDAVKVETAKGEGAIVANGSYRYAGPSITDTNGVTICSGHYKTAAAVVGIVAFKMGTNGTTLTESISIAPTNTSGDKPSFSTAWGDTDSKMTLYHDRVNGFVYPFMDGKVIPKIWTTATGTASAFKYGVQSGYSDGLEIKSLDITENLSLNDIPLHVDMTTYYGSSSVAGGAFFNSFANRGHYIAARIRGVPVDRIYSKGNMLACRLPNVVEMLDCPVGYDPGQNNFLNTDIYFYTPNEVAHIPALGRTLTFLPTGYAIRSTSQATWASNNLLFNQRYNAILGKDVTTFSKIFSQTSLGMSVNQTTGAITSSTNTTAALYVWDPVDKRTREFTLEFSGGALTTVTMNNSRFMAVFDADPKTWVESEAKVISLPPSEVWNLICPTAEVAIRDNLGGEWSAFTPSTDMDGLSIEDGYSVKLRMKSSQISDGERLATLQVTNGVGSTDYTWRLRTRIDQTLYYPDNADSGALQIIKQINEDNGLTLDETMVTVGVPSTYSGFEPGNTQVTISGVPEFGVHGSIDVIYSRLSLTRFTTSGANLVVDVVTNATWTQVVEAINVQYGINLTTDDYEDFPEYTPIASGSTLATLTIKSTSLKYVGSPALAIQVV